MLRLIARVILEAKLFVGKTNEFRNLAVLANNIVHEAVGGLAHVQGLC